jgi:hypothetical protein
MRSEWDAEKILLTLGLMLCIPRLLVVASLVLVKYLDLKGELLVIVAYYVLYQPFFDISALIGVMFLVGYGIFHTLSRSEE